MTLHVNFPLVGEPAALDLLNTVVRAGQPDEQDLLTSVDDLRAWTTARGVHTTGTARQAGEAELRALRRLREDILGLFAARSAGDDPDPAAVRRLNVLARRAVPQLRWDPGQPPTLSPRESPVAEVAASAVDVLGRDFERVRTCAHPDCSLRFLAVNRRRQWCSTATCGNRARAARHYRRRREGGH